MGVGIEVYNADGTLQFDTSNRLFRVLTVQMANMIDGSVNVPELASGTPIVSVQPKDAASGKYPPSAKVSGTTVSWSYNGRSTSSREDAEISIAVF